MKEGGGWGEGFWQCYGEGLCGVGWKIQAHVMGLPSRSLPQLGGRGGVGVTWAEKGTIYEGRHLKLGIGRLQNQVELDSADIST